MTEARDCYTKCLDITPEMAFQLIKVSWNATTLTDYANEQALRAEGVEYVVAPYEADAQLCFLEREGYVDGIITEDSDLLVFGCRQVRVIFTAIVVDVLMLRSSSSLITTANAFRSTGTTFKRWSNSPCMAGRTCSLDEWR